MRKFSLFFCLLIINISSLLIAQNVNDSDKKFVSGITVLGLKRTKLSTAEQPLLKFIGVEAGSLDINEVWAVILNTGILEPVSVELQNTDAGHVDLVVIVREKWSIFPVPVFMASNDGLSAGAALFDANAFGLNDKFFLSGLYLNGGWVAAAGYFHSSPGGYSPGWNGMAVYTSLESKDVDQRNNTLRRFDVNTLHLMAGLNFDLYGLFPFSVSPNVFFEDKHLTLDDNSINAPEQSQRIYGAGLGISYNKSSWDGYLLSGENASLRYSFSKIHDTGSFQSVKLRGVLEKSLIPGFRLVTRAGLVFDPDAPVLFESSPSEAQVDILPQSFSARNYAGVSAGLEKYLLRMSVGTLSLAAAYQVVYSDGSILGSSLDHGLAAKLSFYLSRLAIPAIGLGVAYNVSEQYLQGVFSLGMSF